VGHRAPLVELSTGQSSPRSCCGAWSRASCGAQAAELGDRARHQADLPGCGCTGKASVCESLLCSVLPKSLVGALALNVLRPHVSRPHMPAAVGSLQSSRDHMCHRPCSACGLQCARSTREPSSHATARSLQRLTSRARRGAANTARADQARHEGRHRRQGGVGRGELPGRARHGAPRLGIYIYILTLYP